MRSIFLTICLLATLSGSTQVFELYEDKSYRNNFSDVISVGDSMWVACGSWGQMGSFVTYAYLEAYDTDGVLLWEYQTPPDTEVRQFLNLKQLPNGNIAVCGFEMWCCDCTPPFFQVHILSPNGELVQQVSFESLHNWVDALSVGVSDGLLVAANPNSAWSSVQYSLLAMNHFGDSLWMAEPYANIIDVAIQDTLIVAASDSVLYRYSESGAFVDSLVFEGSLVGVEQHSDGQLALATTYGLSVIQEDFVLEEVLSFDEGMTPTNLFPASQYLCVQFEDQMVCYDTTYAVIQSAEYSPLPYFEQSGIAGSAEYFAMAGWREFEEVATTTYRGAAMYTVGFDGNQTDHFPDLGLHQVQMAINSFEEVTEGVYFVEASPSGYFVNTGDTYINSAYLNYFGPGICNATGNHTLFSNLNLSPGDSAYFEFSEVANYFITSTDSVEVSLCVFLTDPDGYYDRNEMNDEACGQSILWVGNNVLRDPQIKIYPNPTSHQLFIETDGIAAGTAVEILSSTGKIIYYRDELNQPRMHLDISGWNPGLYITRLTELDGDVRVFRFVVSP